VDGHCTDDRAARTVRRSSALTARSPRGPQVVIVRINSKGVIRAEVIDKLQHFPLILRIVTLKTRSTTIIIQSLSSFKSFCEGIPS
jgi:hypothetical protein